jgi:hypothetical protein
VDLEARFLRWRGEAAIDPLSHAGHEGTVAELLPTLSRVVDSDDCQAAVRRSGRVVDLAIRHVAVNHRRERHTHPSTFALGTNKMAGKTLSYSNYQTVRTRLRELSAYAAATG